MFSRSGMFSQRFNKPVLLTRHAQQRMTERHISEAMVADVIETGTLKRRDERYLWVFKH
jgi:hypothetical protein